MKNLILTFLITLLFFLNSAFAQAPLIITWQVLDAKIRPGGETAIFLTLTNSGKVAIRNIEILISPGPYIIPSIRYMKIGGLEAGTSQQTSFSIKVDPKAISTTSYLTIKSTYYPNSEQKETTVNVPITIRTLPILQIEDVKYNPALIEPGNNVQLSFTLVNKGDGSAKDVRVVLTQLKELFTTELEENFISEILPNQKVQVSFNLIINPYITTGVYLIPVSIFYFDETKMESHSSTKQIGLTISGKYNFIVILESQEILAPGGEGEAMIKVVNAGTQEAQFLTLKPLPSEQLIQISPSIAYIGNLKSNDYDTEKFTFKVDKKALPGIYPLKLEISYKDIYGKAYTEEHSIDIKIYSPEEVPKRKIPSLLIVAVGFLTFLLAYIIYKKLSKRKR